MSVVLNTLFEYKNFKGIANTTDTRRIPADYLSVGINVDIDDERRLMRRLGIGETVLSGACHSLWSNTNICLFVENGNLKRLKDDWSSEVLLSNVGHATMVYADDTAGRVYFSNNSIVGFVQNNEAHSFPEPDQTFKKRMVGGHLLEYYNSRLYAAQGNMIIYSDAVFPTRMDARKNFKQFPGFITMMSAVLDGMYISSGNFVYFMRGADPQEAVVMKVTDSPAILYSAIKVDGERIGNGFLGTVVLWLSEDGVFIGQPEGMVRLLTPYYTTEGLEKGAAIYRFDRGFGQYLCVCEYREDKGMASGDMDLPLVSITALGTSS